MLDFGGGAATVPMIKPFVEGFAELRGLPEDTVEQIDAKAAKFKKLHRKQDFVRTQAAADLYVGACLIPKTGEPPSGVSAHTVPTTEEIWRCLGQGDMGQAMLGASACARYARAFHWPLEFPDIMLRGGFDVVLGNPPWERVTSYQEKEVFAARSPEIR